MVDANFYRNKYRFKSQLHIFFKKYKALIIVLSLLLVIGIVVGVFTASKYSGELEMDNILDSKLLAFLKGDKGSFGVFFSYFISLAFVCALIIFLNINKFFAVINMLYFVVRGYIFGFTVFVMIDVFSLAGVINVAILIIPFDLIISFLLIVVSAISIYKNKVVKKFGKICYQKQNSNAVLILSLILILAFVFLKSMCLPLIKITIIVN